MTPEEARELAKREWNQGSTSDLVLNIRDACGIGILEAKRIVDSAQAEAHDNWVVERLNELEMRVADLEKRLAEKEMSPPAKKAHLID